MHACAQSLQLCPTLCNLMDCSPPGSSVHGNSPSKNTGMGCYIFLQGIFWIWGSNQGLWHLLHQQVCSFYFIFLIYLLILIGGKLLYNILVIFDIHWHESTMVYMCPFPNFPPTALPILYLWVVPVHQLWGPCSKHRTWTGCLFQI